MKGDREKCIEAGASDYISQACRHRSALVPPAGKGVPLMPARKTALKEGAGFGEYTEPPSSRVSWIGTGYDFRDYSRPVLEVLACFAFS